MLSLKDFKEKVSECDSADSDLNTKQIVGGAVEGYTRIWDVYTSYDADGNPDAIDAKVIGNDWR